MQGRSRLPAHNRVGQCKAGRSNRQALLFRAHTHTQHVHFPRCVGSHEHTVPYANGAWARQPTRLTPDNAGHINNRRGDHAGLRDMSRHAQQWSRPPGGLAHPQPADALALSDPEGAPLSAQEREQHRSVSIPLGSWAHPCVSSRQWKLLSNTPKHPRPDAT